MSRNGAANTKQMMVVISAADEWPSLLSLLQDSSGGKGHRLTSRSPGSTHIYDLTVGDRVIGLHHADVAEDMAEESISQAMESCFGSCTGAVGLFLLLIQGGRYTKRERKMVEILQAHFGAEAFKYLVIISLEDGKVVEMLDDGLLELINLCDGRYCQLTTVAASDKLSALVMMVDHMLVKNGASGYSDGMLREAKQRSTEDTAMGILRQKVQEAEQKERALRELLIRHEERRAEEVEELRAKHAEERRREDDDRQQLQAKKESLEEAVVSHRAMLQVQIPTNPDDEAKKTSVVFLGLSGSGKSSALGLILERAGNQYPTKVSDHEAPRPTLACERREMFAAGRHLVLVDTPELWDEDGVEDAELVRDCLALSLPGPHVFLLVLQVGRFTQGEYEMLGQLQKIFGRDFAEHAVVLFVRLQGECSGAQRISDYVEGAHATLQDFIRRCGSRYYQLDIGNALSFPQVKELLEGIEKLVASHGGRPHAVKRFTAQELQDRRKAMEETKEGGLEVDCLLRDA